MHVLGLRRRSLSCLVCAIESYLRLHTRLCEEGLLIHSIRFYPIPVAIEVSSRVSRRVIPTSTSLIVWVEQKEIERLGLLCVHMGLLVCYGVSLQCSKI